jgi:tetratricopeptide (TPR) repeat protein
MARKHDWDQALDDAVKSITIQPSLAGYIFKGIALCGQGHIRDARIAFDIASMFTNEDSKTVHFLLLVKTIALFGADQHEEAILLVQQLATACPNNDTLACHVVEAYLHIQLGTNALNGELYNDAAVHFSVAASSSVLSSAGAIDSMYKDFIMLFGWDLKSLWQNAHQKHCDALRGAGRLEEALESFRSMMDMIDENAKARCFDWSNAFKQEYGALYLAKGDAAFSASDYDRAIDLYSVAIELDSASDTVFANCSRAKSNKMLWESALLDAQKVIELSPSSHIGYQLKHIALYGAKRFVEAVVAFELMLAKLDSAHDMQIRTLRELYVSPSEVEGDIRKSVDIQLDKSPLRLLNTTTGLLCDRDAQISAFKSSTEYNEFLLALTTKHPDIRLDRITDVVAVYFRRVMLSHRWGEKEPLLHEISDKVVYELEAAGGLVKLQSFCEIVRKAGYHWAWVDSCCIDQRDNVELQKSMNSMFAWYHHSALTIVYLSDVPPSSKSGALTKSVWNTRGWTVPEFLAPKAILFYQQDWTLYLNNSSQNHKESVEVMHELEAATGIDARTLVEFQPGMKDAREKLQWASTRVTTVPEDTAYSLFGVFGVQLPILYGENKQNALGRLLQEIVARSGDITALDWVGQPSEFNSCLPADIISYAALPCALPSLSEDEIQTAVSSLKHTVALELASKLHTLLDNMSAPRFANCRLHLPCIAFRVTEVKRRRGAAQEPFTYAVKADGLQDLLITSKQTLIQFSRAKPTRQTFLLVRPWDRRLLELPDFEELESASADDTESLGDWSEPESLLYDSDESPCGSPGEELTDSESHLRALRLIVRLGQPFSVFLLAQQRGGEYRRIASDQVIIAQVKDMASIHNMMDIRTPEIL